MNAKPFYLSKTLLGGLVMAVSMACQYYQLGLPQYAVDAATADLDQAVQGITGLVGFIMVIVGRVKASQPIGISGSKTGPA